MKEFNPQEIKYLTENADKDAAALMLQASRYPELPIPKLVQHIQARQKVKDKLPTWYNNVEIRYPATLSVEQSSSEKTAAYKAKLVSGSTLIDLTGGFGIDSYFFSQEFKHVIYVERNPELVQVATHNAQVLSATNIQFYAADASHFLKNYIGKADFIYLDPARRDSSNNKVHLLEDCEPDVLKLLPLLFEKASQVFLKTSPMLDISQAVQNLKQVERIYVVAVENECKEVLYLLSNQVNLNPEISAINLLGTGKDQSFKYNREQEENAQVNYSEPLTYIYEPNTAILKSGGFKALAQEYKVNKLHRNSHLYTSETLRADFPGRIFVLKAISRLHKKELLSYLPDGKANITVRNFTNTVAEIRKKTGIKEGGTIYLLATTDLHQKSIILVCEKV
ncbi:THUMP-like domain-containing protein [Adhaeribacter aquaticus]|uniref:THUMP-like domain-containing protein n=1 Tax=Adhaeribacter aquaticus TaxID=299567 RepID=UPI0003FE7AE7|nr:methyltransferase domain-containing protein [Adhaeribacter aquaticus]